jgi:type VI secretion system protein ImpL
VVFTKADLITGFAISSSIPAARRDRVWGATLTYDRQRGGQDVTSFFSERFDELYAGLKEMSLANMAVRRGENWRRGY